MNIFSNLILTSSVITLLIGCKATPKMDPLEHQAMTIKNVNVTGIADHLPGFDVYKQQGCNACHGEKLEGGLKGPPIIFALYSPSSHSDARLDKSIRQGVKQDHWYFGDMPGYPDMSKQDMKQLINFINTSLKMNDFF
ncbi:c-type cytochrome [Marinicellulosiphila megalodicopiae]|uniref:c-type cytochrome n=1 Tax=Marinicellulosiphila megalodicopiae TaxID=2724896 RepID=UPI003BB109CD